MSRPKDAERTKEVKEKIAEIAINLFIKKGYDKSSINEIIKKSNTNKGTFYHYFSSKEDLINFLGKQIVSEMVPLIDKIAENPNLNALEKLKKCFNSIKAFKFKNHKKMILLGKIMYKEENLKFRYHINNIIIELYVPIFAKIISQGKKEKTLKVNDPEDTAEIMFRFASVMGEMLVPLIIDGKFKVKNIKLFLERAKSYKKILKQILGIDEKGFNIFNFNEKIIKKMFYLK